MGIKISKTVFCDGDDCPEWEWAVNLLVKEVIKEFTKMGWTVIGVGSIGRTFYCPECSKKMQEGLDG